MRAWKLGFALALVLLIATNIIWVYKYIDLTVSYSYQDDHVYHLERARTTLGELVVAGSNEYSQQDILHLLRQAKPDAFIVEREGKIEIEGVVLKFEGDRLESVE